MRRSHSTYRVVRDRQDRWRLFSVKTVSMRYIRLLGTIVLSAGAGLLLGINLGATDTSVEAALLGLTLGFGGGLAIVVL